MKWIILAGIFVAISLNAFSQQKIVIRGKITLLSKSRNIKISGLPEIPIKPDGSFEITGEITEPRVALISTDSSGASSVWLEEGTYLLECSEIKREGIQSVLMRTPLLTGPLDAMIYNHYNNASFNGFTNDEPAPQPSALTEEQKNANKERQRNNAFLYMDSIIAQYPQSKVLPNLIRKSKFFTGDENIKRLIAKLSPAQQEDEGIKQLKNGLMRNEKIAKEKLFENFSMQTADGKDFTLSDIKNKKLILIDFWASDCGPCRITHPRLIELYKKYADKGLEIVSVSIDSNKDKWLGAIADDKIGDWINVSELKNWETSLIKNYAIPFIPFRFLLDGNYKVLSHDDDGQIVVTAGTIEKELIKMGL